MGESISSDAGNLMYIALPLVAFANVVQTIITDNLLRQNYIVSVYVCFCFLLICLFITVSNVCVLRRKPTAVNKPVWKLSDSDLESDDETTVLWKKASPKSELQKLRQFFQSRRIYALAAYVGISFIVISIILKAASFALETVLAKDLSSASLILLLSGLLLEIVILNAADEPEPTYTKSTYSPFSEFIRIPMRNFVQKVVVHLSRYIMRIAGVLFYQCSALYGLFNVSNMPEGEIRRFKEISKVEGIHGIMFAAMIVANIYGLVMLVESVWVACASAKDELIVTFEKNWMRNLIALDFFLPEKEVSSLEELRSAFLEKIGQDLTEEEKRTLAYITKPLWKNKRAFLLKSDSKRSLMDKLTPPLDGTGSSRHQEESSSSSSSKPSPPLTRSRARLR